MCCHVLTSQKPSGLHWTPLINFPLIPFGVRTSASHAASHHSPSFYFSSLEKSQHKMSLITLYVAKLALHLVCKTAFWQILAQCFKKITTLRANCLSSASQCYQNALTYSGYINHSAYSSQGISTDFSPGTWWWHNSLWITSVGPFEIPYEQLKLLCFL